MIFFDEEHIYLRLKELRLGKKVTQSEVADEIEVSREAYTKIESGKGGITVKNLLALSRYYKLDIKNFIWLMTGQHIDINENNITSDDKQQELGIVKENLLEKDKLIAEKDQRIEELKSHIEMMNKLVNKLTE